MIGQGNDLSRLFYDAWIFGVISIDLLARAACLPEILPCKSKHRYTVGIMLPVLLSVLEPSLNAIVQAEGAAWTIARLLYRL